jgi:hypothetical protein
MDVYVHGNNIAQKEQDTKKYDDKTSNKYLKEIRIRYDKWKSDNENLIGPEKVIKKTDASVISKRVALLNDYKEFIEQQKYAEKFDSRSNLQSTVLEEFMCYLFKDLVSSISKNALIGKSHSFKDIFFRASSFEEMTKIPCSFIEQKDHDFAIGTTINAKFQCKGESVVENKNWDIPAIAIECKTYLDKTMLQDVSTAAEQLKGKNQNAMYIVIAEWLKLSEAVNLKKYKIDQIYILRKQKNTDREFRFAASYKKNPIYNDVIEHCFETVRSFLTKNWEGAILDGLKKGYLIN